MDIANDHPLRSLFDGLVRRHYFGDAHVYDADIASYVSGVVTEFAQTETLYRIHNARGQRLTEVAAMLVESNPLLDANSFDREREVRKHVGDFTLFFTGFFPEAVASLPAVHPLSVDKYVDYLNAGKESYAVVAAFNLFEYRDEAPLFKRLSEQFERCVYGLNLVRRDLGGLPGAPC